MTPAEIVKALRCTATVQTGDEPCASCQFNRTETLTEEQKAQLHCEEWHSCDVDGIALAAADLIERMEKEKAERWIPATEPPKDWKDEKTGYLKNYLINCVYSGVDVGSYHAEAGCWLCCGLPVTVTHWMPLPEAPEKRGKYGSRKAERGALRFDSQKEARRYDELTTMLRAGLISDLRLQPQFTLQESYVTESGERTRAVRYTADFSYRFGGKLVVEDVKSGPTRTKEYLRNKKFMRSKYGIDIQGVKVDEEAKREQQEQQEQQQETVCGLPKSGNACKWKKTAPLMCEKCGWNPEEQARRKKIPLKRSEGGKYHKDISN